MASSEATRKGDTLTLLNGVKIENPGEPSERGRSMEYYRSIAPPGEMGHKAEQQSLLVFALYDGEPVHVGVHASESEAKSTIIEAFQPYDWVTDGAIQTPDTFAEYMDALEKDASRFSVYLYWLQEGGNPKPLTDGERTKLGFIS